jgi:hypothetical protein
MREGSRRQWLVGRLAKRMKVRAIAPDGISEELYAEVRDHFSEDELAALIFRVAIINAWNRANIAVRSAPGARDKLFGLDKAGLA